MQDRPDDVPTQTSAQPPAPAGPTVPPAPAPNPFPAQASASASTATSSAGYGPPPGYVPGQPYPYGQAPGFPPQSGGKGNAGRAVLWATVGAVAASALWAGGILVLGPLGGRPDLAGYQAKANLCPSVDYTALRTEYTVEDTAPTHNSLKDKALDQSYCSISLKTSASSSYADAYLSVEMDLHRTTDPSPEFTAVWSAYDQRYEGYDVEKVSGLGDEAYLVSEDTTSGTGTSGSRAVTLAVRDGWMTYQMSWSTYSSSYATTTPPEISEVSRWVKTDTRSTLENLRSG